MSDIRFQCPSCKASLTVPAHLAGVRGPCPFCRNEITAPQQSQAPQFSQASAAAAPPQTAPAQPAHSATPTTPTAAPPAQPNVSPGAQAPGSQLLQTPPSQPAAPHPQQQPPAQPQTASTPPTAQGAGNTPSAAGTSPSFAGGQPAPGTPQSHHQTGGSRPADATPAEPTNLKGRRLIFAGAAAAIVIAAGAGVYFTFFAPSGDEPEVPAIAGQPEPTTPETPGSGEPTPPPPSPATTESTAAQPAPTVAETTTPTSPPTTTNPPPPEPENTRPAPAPAATTTTGDPETDSILGPPREALVEFLAARSWQERKHLVQLPEATIPEMESYYAENPDGPVKYSSITFQNSEAVPNQDTMFYLFHVTTENVPEGFPVSVEETSGGFKIDWQAFVEFNDHHLYKFLSNYTDQPDEFHVIMRRAHFFGSDVPNLENKFAFRIEPPIPGYHGYAFVDKNSNLVDSKLSYQLQWPAISYPIVRLRWKQEATGERYIVLDDLVQNNWRADDADINPGATASSPSRE